MVTRVSKFAGGLGIDSTDKFDVQANATVTIGDGSTTGNVILGGETVIGKSITTAVSGSGYLSTKTILYPEGAQLKQSGAASTGAIDITLPSGVRHNYTMMKLYVSVGDFAVNESFDFVITGYNSAAGWTHAAAYCIADKNAAASRDFTVRYCDDGTNEHIYIGELASTWDYIHVVVKEIVLSYSGASDADWKDGWSISLEASAFATEDTSISTTLLGYDATTLGGITAANYVRSDVDDSISGEIYFSDKVVIGTETANAQLHLSESNVIAYNSSATDGQLQSGATMFIEQRGDSNLAFSQIVMQPRPGYGYNRIVSSGGVNPYLAFITDNAERMRITNIGRIGISNDSPTYNVEIGEVDIAGTANEEGIGIFGGQLLQSTDSTISFYMNDSSNAAGTHNYIVFRFQGSQIGDIDTADNSLIRYNTFLGAHWSQIVDANLLRGTILSTIDEMMEWTNFEYKRVVQNGEETQEIVEKTAMAGHSYTIGQEYEIPIDEDSATAVALAVSYDTDARLAKVKVSDVAGDCAVYGVYGGSYRDGDISVEALGAGYVRVGAGITVQRGDLIESAGDGTGRVQADDIIRSSTVAKITSTIAAETFDDGSKLYPCTLHCG